MVATKKDSNNYILKAKVDDEIRVSGKEYQEMLFKVNNMSTEYNVILTSK